MRKKMRAAAAVCLLCFLCGCGHRGNVVSTEITDMDFDIRQTEMEETARTGQKMPEEEAETPGEFMLVRVSQETISDDLGRELAAGNMVLYREQAELLCGLINDYRQENNLNPLEIDDTMMQIAMHRASENAYQNWMQVTSDESGLHHIRPDGSGVDDIFRSYGKYGTYGEILGRRQSNIEEVFEDWKNSPLHDECMKKEEFEQIGAGIAKSENGEFYYAVVFLKEIP